MRMLDQLRYCPTYRILNFSRSSNARLENKLNLLVAEIRSGKREGSVVSTQTLDTIAQNDKETWESLRRELEDVGISAEVITEKRQFIVTWFQEAVAVGKLEEAASSDDDDSTISLSESNASGSTSDVDDPIDQHNPSMMLQSYNTKEKESKGLCYGSNDPRNRK